MATKKKRILLIVVAVIGVLLIGVVAAIAAVLLSWPPTATPPSVALQPSTDPAVIAEGAYLFHGAAHCNACHAPVEQQIATARGEYASLLPIGGPDLKFGPLGTLRGPNLTSDVETGIGGMTDTELAGIIRYATRADGTPALFMVVASRLTDRDLTAILSYLRSLPPVRNEVAPSELTPLGKILFSTVMSGLLEPSHHGWESPPNVEASDTPSVERGRYLAWGPGNCAACHSSESPDDMWTLADPFGGCSRPMVDEADAAFEFCPPNLTPDPTYGHMRDWTEAQFVERFGAGRRMEGTPMPWESYKHLTDADVRSLWLYLRSLEPIARDTGPVRREAGWKP